jgi:hypothetical protein
VGADQNSSAGSTKQGCIGLGRTRWNVSMTGNISPRRAAMYFQPEYNNNPSTYPPNLSHDTYSQCYDLRLEPRERRGPLRGPPHGDVLVDRRAGLQRHGRVPASQSRAASEHLRCGSLGWRQRDLCVIPPKLPYPPVVWCIFCGWTESLTDHYIMHSPGHTVR